MGLTRTVKKEGSFILKWGVMLAVTALLIIPAMAWLLSKIPFGKNTTPAD